MNEVDVEPAAKARRYEGMEGQGDQKNGVFGLDPDHPQAESSHSEQDDDERDEPDDSDTGQHFEIAGVHARDMAGPDPLERNESTPRCEPESEPGMLQPCIEGRLPPHGPPRQRSQELRVLGRE